jgi:hypothetical protein
MVRSSQSHGAENAPYTDKTAFFIIPLNTLPSQEVKINANTTVDIFSPCIVLC